MQFQDLRQIRFNWDNSDDNIEGVENSKNGFYVFAKYVNYILTFYALCHAISSLAMSNVQ